MAHAMKRVSQLIPAGIEPKKHEKWRNILREKWAGLSNGDNDWLTLSDKDAGYVLVLHEILIGRGLSILCSCPDNVAQDLIKKHYGVLDESELDDLLFGNLGNIRGCATVTTAHVQNWITSKSEGIGGIFAFRLSSWTTPPWGFYCYHPRAFLSALAKSGADKDCVSTLARFTLSFAADPQTPPPVTSILGN